MHSAGCSAPFGVTKRPSDKINVSCEMLTSLLLQSKKLAHNGRPQSLRHHPTAPGKPSITAFLSQRTTASPLVGAGARSRERSLAAHPGFQKDSIASKLSRFRFSLGRSEITVWTLCREIVNLACTGVISSSLQLNNVTIKDNAIAPMTMRLAAVWLIVIACRGAKPMTSRSQTQKSNLWTLASLLFGILPPS